MLSIEQQRKQYIYQIWFKWFIMHFINNYELADIFKYDTIFTK